MPTAAPADPSGLVQHNLPARHRVGMKFWVQTGTHWCMGVHYTIFRVTSRSFYIRSQGRTATRLLVEWQAWLLERLAEGIVDCDGVRLVSPLHGSGVAPTPSGARAGANPPPVVATGEDFTVNPKARDQRFLRAARDVLREASLERRSSEPTSEDIVVDVRRGRRAYVVRFRRDWSVPPRCTCPDATRGGARQAAGFCKHTIAVALRWADLRCQLLDLLL